MDGPFNSLTVRPAPLRVVASPNPFGSRVVDTEFPAGGSIYDIMMALGCNRALYGGCHAYITDRAMTKEPIEIEPHNWKRIKPKPGMLVSIRVTSSPRGGGGGGKNPLRTILSIAIIAASYYVGASITAWAGKAVGEGGLGWGKVGSLVLGGIGGGVTPVVGTSIVNALTPPAMR